MRIEPIYQQQRSATNSSSSNTTNNNMENTASNLAKSNRQKDLINYNLDHVYCSEDSGYRTSGSNNSDLKALRKENKQLQAMLLLHLDLIQEQSNQLIAKDKQLLQLKEENEGLRVKCERLDRRSKTGSRTPTADHGSPMHNNRESLLLDKYKPNNVTKSVYKNIIEEAVTLVPSNINASDIAMARDAKIAVAAAHTTDSKPNAENVVPNKDRVHESSVIGQNNGKLISKIILQRKHSNNGERIVVKTEIEEIPPEEIADSASFASSGSSPIGHEPSASIADSDVESIDTKANIPLVSQDANQNFIQGTQETNGDAITETVASITIKIEKDADDTVYRTLGEVTPTKPSQENKKITRTPKRPAIEEAPVPVPTTSTTPVSFNGVTVPIKRHCSRGSFMSTKKLYKTREWQMDEIEAEVNRQIAAEPSEETIADGDQLEIPKWRTWEFSSVEANPDEALEDMSEEAFIRRHARFLHDERKRKKWDVQRIREQRTIERLKRRHCKEEVTDQRDSEEITSFFPSADSIKAIQITDDLPVSAFGEGIPMLQATDFILPWHKNTAASFPLQDTLAVHMASTAAADATDSHTSIKFISKKKISRVRHQVNNVPAPTVPAITVPIVPSIIVTASPSKPRRTRHRQ